MRHPLMILPLVSLPLLACGGGTPRVNYANGEGSIHWVYERVARPALEEGVEAKHVILEITNPSGTQRIDTNIVSYGCEDALPDPGSPATRIAARCWWAGAGAEAEVYELEEGGDACGVRTRTLDAGSDSGESNDHVNAPWRALDEEIPCPPRATSIQSVAATGPEDTPEDGEVMIETEAPHPTDDAAVAPTPPAH